MRRFYSEKWWERKVDAYISIIESLHEMKQYSDRHLDSALRRLELPDGDQNELIIRFRKAHSELKRRAEMGTLILSSDAINALSVLERKLGDSPANESWVERLDTESASIDQCLKDLRGFAKKISMFPERASRLE